MAKDKVMAIPLEPEDHADWHSRAMRAGYRSTAEWVRAIVEGRIPHDHVRVWPKRPMAEAT